MTAFITCGICRAELTFAAAAFPRGGGIRCKAECQPSVGRAATATLPAMPITPESLARRNWVFNTDVKALWDRQGGRCTLCLDPLTASCGVDHDHRCCNGTRLPGLPPTQRSCGKCVRGLLCPGCNTRLGHMERREPEWLERAARYSRGLPPGRIRSSSGSVWQLPDGRWAYRVAAGKRPDGTVCRRQRNGFESEAEATDALEDARQSMAWSGA